MSTFINGYYLEYRVGDTYCTVTRGHLDEFKRFIGEEMVYRSENWEDCKKWANEH